MKCPKCNVDLLMSERVNTQIDYCPQCRGTWLEQGRLEAIIERIDRQQTARMGEGSNDHDRDDDQYGQGNRGRRRSFLSDLFD